MRVAAAGLLVTLLAACNLCAPTPPPPGQCTSDASCPTGDACLAGSCQSLTQVLQNLSAVVTPPTGNLAPQEYQAIDGTQSSLTLTLAAPQLWDFTVPIPPTCTAAEALPITLRFTGHPIVPLLDWTFIFTTDAAGNVHGALPADEPFDEWIVPATPCVAPFALSANSASGPAPVPIPWASDMLTLVGAVSVAGSSGNYDCPSGETCTFGGASVTIKGLVGDFVGSPISGTVTTVGGAPGVFGFALPVPLAQVTGGGCAPLPADASCDGGSCPVLDDCALFTLEVGPSATQPLLPTVELPVAGRFTVPADGSVTAGPVLSLLGEDGLGVQLPIGPAQLVNVNGNVIQPGNDEPLQLAEVTISCVQPDGGGLCAQGYGYRLSTLSGESGSGPSGFELQVPPNDSYTITATPPPGLGLAPMSEQISVDGSDAGISGLTLRVPAGFRLSGTVLDPSSTSAVGAGQVQALSLATGALVGTTAIQPDGTFQLTLPPAQYMVVVQPDASTGLPDLSEPESLVGDLDLGAFNLYPGARLGGGVFAAGLDGGPSYPVPQASLQFYFITDTQAFGTVALPIASGITDQQGHFSVAVPSSTTPASN